MSELKKEFEDWAISHGGLSLIPANGGECGNGWFPATYAHSLTEIAWRAFANRRTQPPEAVAEKIDAERYRHLRELMQFSTPPNKPTTMKLRERLPAPEHNPHRDWIGEQFDASVDRTVDASLRACLTAEEIPAFDAARQSKESADQSREAGNA